jgi:uncharacterized repeat protein (TIGR02543 family)
MKRHGSSAFSTGILAMAMAVAGLFPAQPAQAQTSYYADSTRECFATPFAGGYRIIDIKVVGANETHHSGDFTIVNTVGDKTYVQGTVRATSGQPPGTDYRPYDFNSTSYFTPTEFFYYATWDNGARNETRHLPLIGSTPATYTVSYDANDATSGTVPSSQTKTHDVTLTLASNSGNLAKTDYTFAGWNTAANGSGTDYAAGGSYTANEAVTLYAKWTAVAAPPTIANAAASAVTAGSATLNGNLTSTGTASTTVYVYWGTVDRGQTTSDWDGSQNLGVRSPGAVSHPVSGLSGGTPYFYRFFAQNSVGSDWGDPATQFETASAPVVDNGGGAANITAYSARLRGALTAGGSAAVTIYWGTVDGGTSPSAWQHTNSLGTASEGEFFSDVSGLNKNSTYRYRCYAENVVGTDWADATATFQTPDWSPVEATGGTITDVGGYRIHTFIADGPFAVTTGGTVEYLVVGGGGGGGRNAGGGGGAGGVRTGTVTVTSQTYPITVGAGGNGSTVNSTPGVSGSTGANSIFSTITSYGGGGGGAYGTPTGTTGSNGGSGGGGGGGQTTGGAAGSGNTPSTTPSQGNDGSAGSGSGSSGTGAGAGGGAGAAGGASTTTLGGIGGIGVQSSITGSATYYGGGGGGNSKSGSAQAGGLGGGGTGGVRDTIAGTSGTPNTGGGGGGSDYAYNGGNGGSGIVIIRYLTVGGGIVDADGDGMSDDWENTYLGGTNAALGGAMEDRDGDGFSNLHEYIAGTDPTNAGSLLKFMQVSPGATTNFVLNWASATGKVYSVKRIADLMTPPWQTVASSIAATPPLNVHTISVTGVKSGFYRVDVQH